MTRDVVIFDIEASCEDRKINPNYNMETIEIGAVKVRQGSIVDKFETFIKPEYITELTDYCVELTGITYADLENAPLFSEAILDFYDFIYGCDIYSSGDFDRKKLTQELREKGYNSEHELAMNAIDSSHTDLKKHYNNITGKKKKGMPGMADELGIELTGTHHRALSDSLNLTKIYLKLEDIRKEELEKAFNEKNISKLIASLNANHDFKITVEGKHYRVEDSRANKVHKYTLVDFLDRYKDLILKDVDIRGLSYLSPPKLQVLKRYCK